MSKRILVVIGHPRPASYCHALAAAYRDGATAAGHTVTMIDLAATPFDPVLHAGYAAAQPLEPALADAQAAISAADHLVFVYPNWWGTMPAALKGFIDRTFLPGFAFLYRKNSRWWDKLLAGKTARLLVTMDTPAWYYRWIYRRPGHNQMRRTILEFCGIKPVRISEFAPIRTATSDQRTRWLSDAAKLGETAA